MPSIIPTSPDQVSEVARALLDAADSPDDVKTDTSGPRLAFVVSDELATRAGFGVYDEDPESLPETETETETVESETVPVAETPIATVEPETVPETKTRAPRKTATKDA